MNYLVTGGSRGIGRAIVLQAVEEGHDVAFTYVERRDAAERVVAEAAARRAAACCRAYRLDVSRAAEVEAVVDAVLEELERVDVVVNCAGVSRDNLAVSMSDEEWDEVISTNLSGPFYVCRQVLPSMLANRFGRIVNVSSIQSRGGTGQANYAASKAGLEGLTMSLAKEYGRRGIRANVVVPGFFETDMTRAAMPDSMRKYWSDLCPMPGGRMGDVFEVARVVTFLGSDAAGFVNGEAVRVTGGLDWTS